MATASGSNTQIQFNTNNDLAASPNLTFDATTGTLSVGQWESQWGDQVLGKATGNLNVRGRILVGTNPMTDDTYGTIRMLGTNRAYGFQSESSGMFVFTNEEATFHQALATTPTEIRCPTIQTIQTFIAQYLALCWQKVLLCD